MVDAESSSLKRKRSGNWLDEDKFLLQELIKERVSAIENKNTDTNTNREKKAAWVGLLDSFNTMCNGSQRTIPQLKTQWSIIKMTAKKAKAVQRREILKTGGGPEQPAAAILADDISSWLPNEFIIDTNEFDSDHIQTVIEKNEDACKSTSNNDNLNQILVLESEGQKGENLQTMEELLPKAISVSEEPPKRRKRPLHIQKSNSVANQNIEAITKLDMECKKSLHSLQVCNEKKRARNLDLEYEVLRQKLQFYKRKNQELGMYGGKQ